MTRPTQPDFAVDNHGTIYLLDPLTDAAREWAEEHLPADAGWFGGKVVIEHRCIADIVAGIRRDGLTVV